MIKSDERKKVIDKFNKLADRYDDIYCDDESKKHDEQLRSILKKFKDDIIIDIGCGTGYLIELIKIEKRNYYGIDISENMIQKAKNKFKNYVFQVTDKIPVIEKAIYVFIHSLNYIDVNILDSIENGSRVIGVLLTGDRMESEQYKKIYGTIGNEISLTELGKYIKFKAVVRLSKYYIYFEGVRNGEGS